MKYLFYFLITISLCSCFKPSMQRYSPYIRNNVLLREKSENFKGKIRVVNFDADYKAKVTPRCRGSALNMPERETPAEVINKALIDELLLANLYSETGEKQIKGHILSISVATFEGKWTIQGVFELDSVKVPISIEHKFAGSAWGDAACNNSAASFMSAVQDFLYKLFSSPEFNEFLAKK